jgi:hypothetical protein
MGDFILCKSVENAKLFGFNTAKGINKGFAEKEDIQLKGKVIGEFVCDEISSQYTQYGVYLIDYQTTSGLTAQEVCEYGNGKMVYFWKISDFVIYEQPKKLSEFFVYCGENPKCDGCEAHYYSNTESGKEDYCCSVIDGHRPLKRPPQSWCYVVEKEGAE